MVVDIQILQNLGYTNWLPGYKSGVILIIHRITEKESISPPSVYLAFSLPGGVVSSLGSVLKICFALLSWWV